MRRSTSPQGCPRPLCLGFGPWRAPSSPRHERPRTGSAARPRAPHQCPGGRARNKRPARPALEPPWCDASVGSGPSPGRTLPTAGVNVPVWAPGHLPRVAPPRSGGPRDQRPTRPRPRGRDLWRTEGTRPGTRAPGPGRLRTQRPPRPRPRDGSLQGVEGTQQPPPPCWSATVMGMAGARSGLAPSRRHTAGLASTATCTAGPKTGRHPILPATSSRGGPMRDRLRTPAASTRASSRLRTSELSGKFMAGRAWPTGGPSFVASAMPLRFSRQRVSR